MFIEINAAYLIAFMFFLTSACYLYFSIVTFTSNADSRIRRSYLATGLCLVFYSLCYGLMTISAHETLRQVFWAIGFTSGFLFFPAWILFLLNVVIVKHRLAVATAKIACAITVLISIACIFSKDAELIMTPYGNEFSYNHSPFFIIAFIFASSLAFPLLIYQLRWWREAKLKRHRKLAFSFILVTTICASIGFITDFMIPIFTDETVVPLGPISIMAASSLTYIRMLAYKKLNITIHNVSGFTFSTVTMPILVLDNKNNIGLENRAAIDFFGGSVVGKNIADTVLKNNNYPEQSFFRNSFAGEIVTIETFSGVRTCEMLLTVEKDKLGDVICKAAILRDVTESNYKDSLLEAVNRVSGTLLEPDIHNFEDNLYTAMGMMAVAMDADRVYVWKNHVIDDLLHCTQIYEWSETADSQQDNEYTVDISYADMMPGIEDQLSSGHCINGIVKNMIPEHQAHLTPQGILSIMIVPVFVQDQFWGFVGFDDCQKERVFTENEEMILRSAGRMIANSIVRNDMTRQLESALTDELTGARNRRYFMEAAEKELQHCIRGNHPYSLIIIDVDFFKKVNDSHGHPVGDVVLKILVARIRRTLKLDTLVTRYGGEEFVVTLPEISNENALRTAERIRYNIESNIFKINDLKLNITISLGVATLTEKATTLPELISNADKALYQAKETGRNRVVAYESDDETN